MQGIRRAPTQVWSDALELVRKRAARRLVTPQRPRDVWGAFTHALLALLAFAALGRAMSMRGEQGSHPVDPTLQAVLPGLFLAGVAVYMRHRSGGDVTIWAVAAAGVGAYLGARRAPRVTAARSAEHRTPLVSLDAICDLRHSAMCSDP